MDTNKKIKELYNISFDLTDVPENERYPIHDWYSNLINKTYYQINIFDVTRMIIQKVFMELAVSKAIHFIEKNPFCGQRYEGELLELLNKLDVNYLKEYKLVLNEILSKALDKNKVYEWLCEDERIEFSELVKAFLKKIETF